MTCFSNRSKIVVSCLYMQTTLKNLKIHEFDSVCGHSIHGLLGH